MREKLLWFWRWFDLDPKHFGAATRAPQFKVGWVQPYRQRWGVGCRDGSYTGDMIKMGMGEPDCRNLPAACFGSI
jgi:hypothetical protein